jgi:sugar lactone lactonase YvrE
MAIVGDTIWVADIDAVRGFHKRTGAAVATVDLAPMRAVFLNDVVAAPDGSIYVTDTGIRFEESGMTHPGPDRIFRIAGRTATVAAEGDVLARPNGIAWDASGQRFLIAPFGAKAIASWTPGAQPPAEIASGPGDYDGIEVLADGRILVSSWADSAVHVLRNGTFSRVITNVEGPADFGIDTKRNVLALPRFGAGRVQYFRIP